MVETLGDIPYDAVFMPEGGLALRNLAPLLPYFDIDPRRVKFIGTGLWDDPTLSQEPPCMAAGMPLRRVPIGVLLRRAMKQFTMPRRRVCQHGL